MRKIVQFMIVFKAFYTEFSFWRISIYLFVCGWSYVIILRIYWQGFMRWGNGHIPSFVFHWVILCFWYRTIMHWNICPFCSLSNCINAFGAFAVYYQWWTNSIGCCYWMIINLQFSGFTDGTMVGGGPAQLPADICHRVNIMPCLHAFNLFDRKEET